MDLVYLCTQFCQTAELGNLGIYYGASSRVTAFIHEVLRAPGARFWCEPGISVHTLDHLQLLNVLMCDDIIIS